MTEYGKAPWWVFGILIAFMAIAFVTIYHLDALVRGYH